MAERAQPISATRIFAGGAALAALLVLTLGTTFAVWSQSIGASAGFNAADWAALRFTVSQAVVSATLSVLLAIPVARALARRRFFGRGLLITLLGAPFILPGIVAVFGLLAIWGRSGIVSDILVWGGFDRLSIYGFKGVVLAHVFFNLPLATRLLLQGWAAIPTEQFRLAAQLGMASGDVNRWLERPMLRETLPGAFLMIFLLCLTSFAVALAVGGGPRATTVELAIYQALRFEFDLSKAAQLAVVQFVLCTVTAAVALKFAQTPNFSMGLGRPAKRFDARTVRARIWDGTVVLAIAVFLLAPMLAIVASGVPALFDLPGSVWTALLTSIFIAVLSSVLALLLALALSSLIVALSRQRKRAAQWTEAVGFLALAASPFVVGTGLFVIINPLFDPFALALPVLVAVNAVMALPFCLRILLPGMMRAEAGNGRLGRSLGMTRWVLFRHAIWPGIRRPAGFAAGLAAALSMGDLGVVALFAPPDFATLPLAMYRLMGAYRMDEAAGAALVLVMASLVLFWIFDRGGRLDHNL